MENKQTAVEFLIEHIKLDAMYEAKSIDEWVNIFQLAKAMEKEQIKDSFVECYKANVPDGFECKLYAEQYYEETYGK